MAVVPVPRLAQPPTVDDVAHQVQPLATQAAQEIGEEFAEHAMQSAAARFYERIADDQDGRKEEIAVMNKFLGRAP